VPVAESRQQRGELAAALGKPADVLRMGIGEGA
jgi:hypothetical protein